MLPIHTLSSLILVAPPNPGKVATPSVHGVTLNQTKSEVIKRLGKPRGVKPHEYDRDINDNGNMIELHYPGLTLLLADMGRQGEFRVLEIQITKPHWVVVPGLTIGQTAEAAQQAFPDLVRSDDPNRPGKEQLHCNFPFSALPEAGYLHLDLDQNLVTRIVITSDLD